MYKDKLSAPAQEQAPKEDSEPGLLFTAFADEADELPPAETDIPLLLDEVLPNNAASNEINTSSVQVQTPVRQRKVSKIIVLFDDGTYQEM
jgi:hypothetical protein